ncbi:hypothetical protein C1A40_09215 [Tamlana carrageenivorans]|uniref:Uncharacterized protein n=1 Tax=Pseudotamlana carrageenivorans TaxID=2069432 RepID=A0A2I7SIA2_9FLAO|nr:hypothetical protein C1A40_09215 [Tamlana carrageenivorans]
MFRTGLIPYLNFLNVFWAPACRQAGYHKGQAIRYNLFYLVIGWWFLVFGFSCKLELLFTDYKKGFPLLSLMQVACL